MSAQCVDYVRLLRSSVNGRLYEEGSVSTNGSMDGKIYSWVLDTVETTWIECTLHSYYDLFQNGTKYWNRAVHF